ncbi:hypothetical protein ABK040_001609 [Willaertia magna]
MVLKPRNNLNMNTISNNNNRKSPTRRSPRKYSKYENETKHHRGKSLEEVLDELCVKFILNCPEEEHESFDRLFFQIEEAYWFYLDFYRENDPSLPKLNLHQFADKVFAHCPYLKPYQATVEQHIKSFINYKTSVPVCGVVLLDESLENVVLVKGWNSKSWSFPRGKINKDEEEVTCAIREGKEEVGFDCSSYILRDQYLEGQFSEQYVKLFISPFVPIATKFNTQTRKEISQICWFNIDEIMRKEAKGNFWSVKPFLQDLKQWINNYKMTMPSIMHTPSDVIEAPRTPPRNIKRSVHHSPSHSTSTPFKQTPNLSIFQRKQLSPQNNSPALSYSYEPCEDMGDSWLNTFSFEKVIV